MAVSASLTRRDAGRRRTRDSAVLEEAFLHPQGHMDQANQHRHFDQRPDDSREGDTTVDTKGGNRHSDGEFKVVRRRGEGERGGLLVVGTDALAQEEGHNEHDDEVESQWHGDADASSGSCTMVSPLSENITMIVKSNATSVMGLIRGMN